MTSGADWIQDQHNDGNSGSVSARKIPLAEYRYGKEEMISLHSDTVPLPIGIFDVPTIVRQTALQPLAFVPLTEEEQVVLTGNVNSGFVYSSRGRGGYYRGSGGRGRGRGGRTDYHRSSSGGDELSDRGGYYRSNSDSAWNDEGKSSYQTRGGRASRDSNWRATQPTIVSSDSEDKVTKNSSTGGDKRGHWNPLPEWATDDTEKSVGAFDGEGRFSTSEMDNADKHHSSSESEHDDDEYTGKKIDIDSFEDVFEKEGDVKSNDTGQDLPHGEVQSVDRGGIEPVVNNEHLQVNQDTTSVSSFLSTKPKDSRVESVDSVEEMQRRFEKAAEAVLSTEDEDTPSPSPNFNTAPNQLLVQSSTTSSSVTTNMESTEQWLYKDPRGELQGPFKNHEMSEWFAAGYFTMELTIKRVCDAMFLPLGQIIRIWGRVPFSSGPQPPPLQQSEPFWQQMFSKQQQLFPQTTVPPGPPPPAVATVPSDTQQPTPSSTVPPQPPPPSSSSSDPSPIWGSITTRISPEEEQWPDLNVIEQRPQPVPSGVPDRIEHVSDSVRDKLKLVEEEEEKRRKAEIKLEEEIARKIEEDRKREIEEKRKIEADIKKRKEEEKKQRAIEQEKIRQQKLEEEKKKQLLQKEKEKADLIRRQKEEELKQAELKMLEEQEKIKKDEQKHLSHVTQPTSHPPLQSQQHHLPQHSAAVVPQQKFTVESEEVLSAWLYGYNQPTTPSLLQIQQEEKKKEKVLSVEKRLILQQQQHMLEQQQQQQLQSNSWSSQTSSGSKQLSFLEIQQEQERLFSVRDDVATGKNSTKKFNAQPSQSSWSKVASTKPPAPSNWGSSHSQSVQSSTSSSVPSQKDNSLSFWEECARETPTPSTSKDSGSSGSKMKTGGRENDTHTKSMSNKGTAKKREEEKVRELFSCKGGDDSFTVWCAEELVKFNTDVDAATFVSLLLEVESTYEVHDYIKSFLGETDEVHSFAKQFLERRQKLKNYGQQQHHQKKPSTSDSASSVNTTSTSNSSRSSKKKKKGKMQKMPPSALLGFTVNAAERPNAGEIHSIKDAL